MIVKEDDEWSERYPNGTLSNYIISPGPLLAKVVQSSVAVSIEEVPDNSEDAPSVSNIMAFPAPEPLMTRVLSSFTVAIFSARNA